MRLKNIFDNQKRSRFQCKAAKKIIAPFKGEAESKPCFIMGVQRSGTTMIMHAFHRHKNIFVYDESRQSQAFFDYRLRELDVIKKEIDYCRFRAIIFKPLADSHLVNYFLYNIPELKIIWPLRNYKDVANSTLRHFPSATHAIRKVMENKDGGGWFQEGITQNTLTKLNELDYNSLSQFDLACLIWWSRNRIYLESQLQKNDRVKLVSYEKMVNNPEFVFKEIFNFLEVDYYSKTIKFIHNKSICKNEYPPINGQVDQLCRGLTRKMGL